LRETIDDAIRFINGTSFLPDISFEKLRESTASARCIPARNKNAGRLIPFIDRPVQFRAG